MINENDLPSVPENRATKTVTINTTTQTEGEFFTAGEIAWAKQLAKYHLDKEFYNNPTNRGLSDAVYQSLLKSIDMSKGDANRTQKDGQTLLHRVCFYAFSGEIFKYADELKVKEISTEKISEINTTLKEQIQALIQREANTECAYEEDNVSFNPLHHLIFMGSQASRKNNFFCDNNFFEAADLLITHAKNPKYINSKLCQFVAYAGKTLLSLAAEATDTVCDVWVPKLICKGADPLIPEAHGHSVVETLEKAHKFKSLFFVLNHLSTKKDLTQHESNLYHLNDAAIIKLSKALHEADYSSVKLKLRLATTGDVTDESMKELAEALKETKANVASIIFISKTQVTNKGLKAIIDATKIHTSLTEIKIEGPAISKEIQQELIQVLERNKNAAKKYELEQAILTAISNGNFGDIHSHVKAIKAINASYFPEIINPTEAIIQQTLQQFLFTNKAPNKFYSFLKELAELDKKEIAGNYQPETKLLIAQALQKFAAPWEAAEFIYSHTESSPKKEETLRILADKEEDLSKAERKSFLDTKPPINIQARYFYALSQAVSSPDDDTLGQLVSRELSKLRTINPRDFSALTNLYPLPSYLYLPSQNSAEKRQEMTLI